MKGFPDYSVLMSVYGKDEAHYLRLAMESMWDQTVPPKELVLVCDGPLSKELDDVISDMRELHNDSLVVCRLKENCGLGNALNHGLCFCSNDLVARMDADDISRPDRCERQLSVFMDNPSLSIVSGTVQEFHDRTEWIDAERCLPETNQEIIEFAKSRNPFNHPCVMYRKSSVDASGGYQDFYLLEDYYLWIRMIQNGVTGYNLQEPLLWMRAGSELYKRRGGQKYALSQVKLFRYMWESGFVSYREYVVASISRLVLSLVPNGIRKLTYQLLAR